ncbi:MAG: M48 family metallopeptidase [Saprospiraceae bacterium]
MGRKKAKHIYTTWDINGVLLPVKLYFEWRRTRRVSIGKNHIIVRMPWLEKNINADIHVKWAKEWLKKQLVARPQIFDHMVKHSYKDADILHTTQKVYSLSISKQERKTGSAKLNNKIILIKLPNDITKDAEDKMIHTLIGRILAYDNHKWVEEKVLWLNQHYIGKPIKSVKLKNNRSNWGSCSSGGNINISVRLLFAPEDVQDYVLIHELAHLKEMNHTSRFWKIVEDIMPDYKQKEKWLKENNHLCNF